jgi:hypothetical protein
MNFEEWNAALGRFFFNPSRAGKRVYLHTTKELLRELSGTPRGVEDFIAAIKEGPVGIHGEMCMRAYTLFRDWRQNQYEYPPYLTYLCLFSLAAAHEGTWARHAYYPRLWDVLGEKGDGAPRHFRTVSWTLWHDLEVWAHNDKKGEWGLFKYQSAIDWEYVGLPISQTILTDEEREVLPSLFEEADLEPGTILPEGQLAAKLAPIADKRLRRRTVQLLLATQQSDYRSSLLENVQAELSDWDGSVHRAEAPDNGVVRAGLRIWLKEIDPAGFIESRLVAFLPPSLLADEMLLENQNFPSKHFECQALFSRLTDALRDSDTNEELSAEKLRWDVRNEFRCVQTGARLVLQSDSVRIFCSGGSEVTGFIESKRVPSSGEFYIAAFGSAANEINDWGMKNCRAWTENRIARGLPQRWRLFSACDVTSDGRLASKYPALSRPNAPRIRFEGGVRGGNGASYFPFALPQVRFDWHSKPSLITCNGKPLSSVDGIKFDLTIDVVQDVNEIEGIAGDVRAKMSFFVVNDGWQWGEGADCPAVNGFGTVNLNDGAVRIRGAIVDGVSVPPFVPDTEAIVEETDCAVLLGRIPGQVADLRRGEELPDWQPVWAVSIARRNVIFAYCGTSLDSSAPESGAAEGNPKRWASIIWVNRKRTLEIRHPRIRQLLAKYREVARGI